MTDPLAALSTPRRREILRLVWSGERAAGEIHRAMADVTFGAVSQHLRRLEEAGLVEVRVEGRHRLYRARREELGPVAAALESMWDDALYRLRLHAELEAARRGPRATASRRLPASAPGASRSSEPRGATRVSGAGPQGASRVSDASRGSGTDVPGGNR